MDGKFKQTTGTLCRQLENNKHSFCAMGMLAFEAGYRPHSDQGLSDSNGSLVLTNDIGKKYFPEGEPMVVLPRHPSFNRYGEAKQDFTTAIITMNDCYKMTPKQIGEWLATQGL